jgi:hypothetical protein
MQFLSAGSAPQVACHPPNHEGFSSRFRQPIKRPHTSPQGGREVPRARATWNSEAEGTFPSTLVHSTYPLALGGIPVYSGETPLSSATWGATFRLEFWFGNDSGGAFCCVRVHWRLGTGGAGHVSVMAEQATAALPRPASRGGRLLKPRSLPAGILLELGTALEVGLSKRQHVIMALDAATSATSAMGTMTEAAIALQAALNGALVDLTAQHEIVLTRLAALVPPATERNLSTRSSR